MRHEALVETDRKVAEAIGGRIEESFWVFDSPNGRHIPTVSTPESHDPIYDDESRNAFRPSSEWDDAMWAAERAMLFHVDIHRHVLIQHSDGWCVHDLDGDSVQETSKAETGPLAICQAILALSLGTKTEPIPNSRLNGNGAAK